jgi:hypothetical protein
MICPFCREKEIGKLAGTSICPACNTEYDIDDRGECVFMNMESPNIPISGQVCMACGLIQQDRRETCAWCGADFNKKVH